MLKILAAAYDAGGAEVLAALIKGYRGIFKWSICAAGPAVSIFGREGLPVKFNPDLLKTSWLEKVLRLSVPDLVLTGTGWATTMELDLIRCSKAKGIRTAAFLDHWSNYRERFGYPSDWLKALPDQVFVGDPWAYRTALKVGFPRERLVRVENRYFAQIERLGQRARKNSGTVNVLYFSTPITDHAKKAHGHAGHWGTTEYDHVDDVLNIVAKDKRMRLRVRLHPAEKAGKYSYLKGRKNVSVTDPRRVGLMEDCFWADIAVGCDTMALVVAFMAGRKAISYIPGGGLLSTLPQEGIVKAFSKAALEKHILVPLRRSKTVVPEAFFKIPFPGVIKGLSGVV